MDKSPDAFRTISEVADLLGTPAHVLRFWESRFPQIRPVKRAGGRRYYRPADVLLLTGIKSLLHDQGMTIRGVQKILREQGVRHVAALSGTPLPEVLAEDSAADLEQALAQSFGYDADDSAIEVEPETATIIALETALRQHAPTITTAAVVPPAPISPMDITDDLPLAIFGLLPDQATSDLVPETEDDIAIWDIQAPDAAEFDHEIMASDADVIGLEPFESALLKEPPLRIQSVAFIGHPFELARRLRAAPKAALRLHAGELALIADRLSAIRASLGDPNLPPIQALS